MDFDFSVKTIVVGDSAIGKSNFVSTFVNSNYTDVYLTTIGVDFFNKFVTISPSPGMMIPDPSIIKLQIWDTSGQERFRTITSSYYRGAQVILIGFDLTNLSSYLNLGYWLAEIGPHRKSSTVVALIGFKSDLIDHRQVPDTLISSFCQVNQLQWFPVSSKKRTGLQEVFDYVIEEYFSRAEGLTIESIRLGEGQRQKTCCW